MLNHLFARDRYNNNIDRSILSTNNLYYTSPNPIIPICAVIYSIISNLILKICRIHIDRPLPMLLPPPPTSNNNIEKIAIITGSNTGIGYETARQLVVQYGYTVILACRSRDKAIDAMNCINQEVTTTTTTAKNGGSAIFVAPLDLSSLKSVRHFCQVMKEQYNNEKVIHVLINNAGLNAIGSITGDENQFDYTFHSNFLGHFLLTNLLFDMMIPHNGRIINLSSVRHHFCGGYGDIRSETLWKNIINPNESPKYTYPFSKLASILFTIELNRRYMKSNGIQSIAVNPGAVNSDIWRRFPKIRQLILPYVFLSSEQGSRPSVAAAVLEDIQMGVTDNPYCCYIEPYYLPGITLNNVNIMTHPIFEMLGPYQGYRYARPRIPLSTSSSDDSILLTSSSPGEALWKVCEEITGCQWPES